MIVNWNKPNAGVLVIPCMKNNLIVKQIFIVPGHNDILEEEWEMAKASVKDHITAGHLVIFEKKVEAVKKGKALKKEKVTDFNSLLTVAKFPHLNIVKAIKELDLYPDICAQKKAVDGKATLNKAFLLQYMIDNEEDFEKVTDLLYPATSEEDVAEGEEEEEEDIPEVISALKLTEMSSEQATTVITDTYCIKTLNKWKKEVTQPDLRVLIINQIEVAVAPPRKGRK